MMYYNYIYNTFKKQTMAKSNKAQYAILGALSIRDASGYDIKKFMGLSTNHFWKENDASIYPILKQLLKQKLVTCKIEDKSKANKKTKKIYALTSQGQEQLQKWLKEEPELFQNRNELLLKVFFGWNVEPKITIEHLEYFRETVKNKLKEYKKIYSEKLEKIGASKQNKIQLYQWLTLKSGIMHAETSMQWCEQAINTLKK